MVQVPKKVADRLAKTVPAYQKVLGQARDRDINESDTVTIITDTLAEVFGFDKYTEITSELAIRGTYCDLAVQIDGKTRYLIEVKAIGLTLRENHLRQAVGYGANNGIPWVVLTNGMQWEVYRVTVDQKVTHELVCTFDFSELRPRASEDQEKLFLLCKEGLAKAAIEEFHDYVRVVNKMMVSAIIQTDSVLSVIRRELRRVAPGTKVSTEEISGLLPDVLKREVIEGEAADEARSRVAKASKKSLRKTSKKDTSTSGDPGL
jgi:hypothetical protein